MQEPARKIAENVIVLALARSLNAGNANDWAYLMALYRLAGKQAQRDPYAGDDRAEFRDVPSEKATDVSGRLIAVETKQVQDAAAGARFQSEMLGRMDRMQDAIVGLSNSVSALTATVQALAENQRQNRRPP